MKTALIIGASGGIGQAVARALAKNHNLILCSNTKDCEELFSDIKEKTCIALDLSDEKKTKDTIEQLSKKSPIDVVIHAVSAKIENKKIDQYSWEDYQTHLDVQIKGLVSTVQALAHQAKTKHKTKIITILTEYAYGKPPSLVSPYVTAKYALLGLSKSIAVEYASSGWTCNMVSPTMTKTDLLSHLPDKFVEMAAHTNPQKRIATPEDVADVVAFLTSSNAEYLNGVNIPITGGNTFL